MTEFFISQGKTKGFELLDKVFMSLNLYEKDYFGLRFRDINDKTVRTVAFHCLKNLLGS